MPVGLAHPNKPGDWLLIAASSFFALSFFCEMVALNETQKSKSAKMPTVNAYYFL